EIFVLSYFVRHHSTIAHSWLGSSVENCQVLTYHAVIVRHFVDLWWVAWHTKSQTLHRKSPGAIALGPRRTLSGLFFYDRRYGVLWTSTTGRVRATRSPRRFIRRPLRARCREAGRGVDRDAPRSSRRRRAWSFRGVGERVRPPTWSPGGLAPIRSTKPRR